MTSKQVAALPGRRRAPRTSAAGEPSPRSARNAFGDLEASGRLVTVPVDAIEPNPSQPRKAFDPEDLQRLADSIAELGILQPPVAREITSGRWQLIAGERRLRAARLAGKTHIEVLRDSGDRDETSSALLAILENTARADLSPVEEARAYASLVEDLGISREEVGRRVGRSRASVSNHIRLLALPGEALDLLEAGRLSFAHGRALLLAEDPAVRKRLAVQAAEEDWSTRQLEAAARAAGEAPVRPRVSAAGREETALAQRLTESLSSSFGRAFAVKPTARGGYTFQVTAESAEEAEELAQRLSHS